MILSDYDDVDVDDVEGVVVDSEVDSMLRPRTRPTLMLMIVMLRIML